MRPGLALLLLVVALGARADGGGNPWADVLERNGVRVWKRDVSGSKIAEVRGHAVVGVHAERLFAVLGDVESYPDVIPPTVEARLLGRDGGDTFYYMVIDPPLVARRDYCLRTSLTRLGDGRLRAGWVIAPEVCPAPRPGVVRLHHNTGHWLLTPRGDGTTDVAYQAHTDPGGAVPAWIVNRSSTRQLPDIFAAVIRAAGQPKYAR